MAHIAQSELTASERTVLAEDRARWERMGGGAHLDDWLAYGPGLLIRRRLAMKLGHVNRPEGRNYAAAFSALMEKDGLHTMDKTSISAVLWLEDNPEHLRILREIRETMTVGERSRLNSPIAARQQVEKILKVRAGGVEETLRTSPFAMLKRKVAEQDRQLADLQERLASAQRDADRSFFDIKLDRAEHIGRALADNVSQSKFRRIVDSALARYKAKQSPAPAG